ncbi:hypothetical protein NEPTK9_000741 [Candidatus Neptunochlamydia vexilliferae]|uniref:Secreted protein n=1 Tax=Candidatus Neptunichlamydia vexilliferae TaxID=1651774 RepID=A0ABS0AYM9_9BACT|nr:hypothetical protein [Candidatus Neptunochlamydia vexilliferae]
MNLSLNSIIFPFPLFCIFLPLYVSPLSFGQCAQIERQKPARKFWKIKNDLI